MPLNHLATDESGTSLVQTTDSDSTTPVTTETEEPLPKTSTTSPTTTAPPLTSGTAPISSTSPLSTTQICRYDEAYVKALEQQVTDRVTQQTASTLEELRTQLTAAQISAKELEKKLQDEIAKHQSDSAAFEKEKQALLAKTCPSESSLSFLPWLIKKHKEIAQKSIDDSTILKKEIESKLAALPGEMQSTIDSKAAIQSILSKATVSRTTSQSDLEKLKQMDAKATEELPKYNNYLLQAQTKISELTSKADGLNSIIANHNSQIKALNLQIQEKKASIPAYQKLLDDALNQVSEIAPQVWPWISHSTAPTTGVIEETCLSIDPQSATFLETVLNARIALNAATEDIRKKEAQVALIEAKIVSNENLVKAVIAAQTQAKKLVAMVENKVSEITTLSSNIKKAMADAQNVIETNSRIIDGCEKLVKEYDLYYKLQSDEVATGNNALSAIEQLIKANNVVLTTPDNNEFALERAFNAAETARATYSSALQKYNAAIESATKQNDAVQLSNYNLDTVSKDSLTINSAATSSANTALNSCPRPVTGTCDPFAMYLEDYNTALNTATQSVTDLESKIQAAEVPINNLISQQKIDDTAAANAISTAQNADTDMLNKARIYLQTHKEKVCRDPSICEIGKETPDCKSPYDDKPTLQKMIEQFGLEKNAAVAEIASLKEVSSGTKIHNTQASTAVTDSQSNVDLLEPKKKAADQSIVDDNALVMEQDEKINSANIAKQTSDENIANSLNEITTQSGLERLVLEAKNKATQNANELNYRIAELITMSQQEGTTSVELQKIADSLKELAYLNEKKRKFEETARQEQAKASSASKAQEYSTANIKELKDIQIESTKVLADSPLAKAKAQDALQANQIASSIIQSTINSMKAVIEQAIKINSKVMLYNNAISTQIEADQRLITALSEAARLGQALLGATTYKDIEAAKTALHKAESEVAAARQALSMPRLQLIVLKQNYQRSIRDSRDSKLQLTMGLMLLIRQALLRKLLIVWPNQQMPQPINL